MDAVTIAAANYLPFVNVLGNSYLRNNPQGTFTVLVIDSEKIDFPRVKSFKYLSPADLAISNSDFQNMAFYYNVTELATALKPSAMKYLFNKGSSKVIYLDPDIEVFSELSELDLALDKNSIVLTPHTLDPIPRDGLRPTEADIMGSGTFNLGFLGLAKSTESTQLLDWWEERLRFDSISDPSEMLFTDQRWIDLVPSYFPIKVLRNPGYNVAYWNLHERKLSGIPENIKVNGQELKFFHFSGYRPDKPWILSKYVADNPRITISEDSLLESLCAHYGEKCKSFGWINENMTPYGFGNFENGNFIPSSLRRLYRDDCKTAHNQGVTLTPPSNWQQWACERSYDSGNLSRILFSIWKSRPDLKRRYPDATGNEAMDFLAWAKNHGISERVIDSDFTEILGLSSDVIPNLKTKQPGINVAGYLNAELGVGQSARLILKASELIQVPTSAVSSNRVKSRKEETFNNADSEFLFSLTIAIVNADHFRLWVRDFGEEFLSRTTVIGVWAWETEDFPEVMHAAFRYVDEIWAVSNFVKNAIAKHTKKPVYVLPTPIVPPTVSAELDRKLIGISESEQYNLFIFDYMSTFNRKNPLGLVKAHISAFPNLDGPKLIIKSINGDKDAINREKLRYEIRKRNDIYLIEDYMSREQLTALINECSAYISLHRSEGFGLTLAEAMALGKPTIATNYSGNLDFMTSANSMLVPYKLIPIGEGSDPYLESSHWADPDLDVAAKYMQNLHRNKDLAMKLGLTALESVSYSFTFERTGDFILSRVKYHYALQAKLLKRISNLKHLKNRSFRHIVKKMKKLAS